MVILKRHIDTELLIYKLTKMIQRELMRRKSRQKGGDIVSFEIPRVMNLYTCKFEFVANFPLRNHMEQKTGGSPHNTYHSNNIHTNIISDTHTRKESTHMSYQCEQNKKK